MEENEYIENETYNKYNFLKYFTFKNIALIIISIIVSSITVFSNIPVLSFVMLCIASFFNFPLLIIFITSLIGISIFNFSVINIVNLSVFFIVFTLITSIINIEGISKKFIVLFKLAISLLITMIISVFYTNNIDILTYIYDFLIINILYIVFLIGMYVLLNLRKGFVFSNEENIAFIVLLSFCISSLSDVVIFNLSLSNILFIITIIIFSMKRGITMGIISATIVGIIMLITKNINETYLIVLIVSAAISGLFYKFKKVYILLGFVLGYMLTSYLTSNFTIYSINISEVLIACFLILLFPKKLEEKINNFFTYNNKLDDNSVLLLESNNVINKLNVMSDIFDELSINNLSSFDYIEETREAITKYLTNYINDNCYNCDNINNCIDKNNISKSVELIITKLQNREELNIDILNINCKKNDELIKNINDIYNNIKIMKILKKQEEENTKKISMQYSNISDIIANISKDISNKPIKFKKNLKDLRNELKLYGYYIYEDDFKNNNNNIEYTIITNILTDIDNQKKELTNIVSNILETNMSIKLVMSTSKALKTKIKFVSSTKYIVDSFVINNSKEEVSGDSYLVTNIEDKHISAISDGAGSGSKASKNSLSVINSLDKLLNNGFSNKTVIDIINNIISLKTDNDYATLDLCIIDLNTNDSIYVKYGASKTYIINNNKLTYINKENIPLGLLNEFTYIPISKKLEENDVIIQFSDGIIIEENLLKKINLKDNIENISNYILKNSICENDDITLIVTKIKLNK